MLPWLKQVKLIYNAYFAHFVLLVYCIIYAPISLYAAFEKGFISTRYDKDRFFLMKELLFYAVR